MSPTVQFTIEVYGSKKEGHGQIIGWHAGRVIRGLDVDARPVAIALARLMVFDRGFQVRLVGLPENAQPGEEPRILFSVEDVPGVTP